ncbi:MAG: hypothetical protein R3E01_22365 [Pirellulaceae bacterium]
MSGQPIAELKNMGQWTKSVRFVKIAYIYPYFNKSKHVRSAATTHAKTASVAARHFNNIDLMMIQGHDFLPAVEILFLLAEYQRPRSSQGT